MRDIWGVASDDDVSWILARLTPTPFRHFTDRLNRTKPVAVDTTRTFIRCRQFQLGKHPAFDRHAKMAQQTAGWHYRELATPHLPYVTHPVELAEVLLDLPE